MEFILVKNRILNFGESSTPRSNAIAMRAATAVPVEIIRKPTATTHQGDENESYAAKIEELLVRNTGRKRRRLDTPAAVTPPPHWTMDVFVFHHPTAKPKGHIKIISKIPDQCCFSQIADVCGGFDKFTVSLDLELEKDGQVIQAEAKQLKVRHFTFPHASVGFKGTFDFIEPLTENWRTVGGMTGKLSMYLNLNGEALDKIHVENLEDPLSINKKMLRESILTDCTVIGEDGEEIKCHKGFLSAHSPVFHAMFENQMKEGISSTVELPDISASAVRALLAYCYCWEVKKASESCSVALELLLASEKYNILTLHHRICEVMLSKDKTWFTVAAAVQLFQFVRTKIDQLKKFDEKEKDIYKQIEAKTVTVLKSTPKKELHECSEFQQLFTDPQVAMEFCSYFIANK